MQVHELKYMETKKRPMSIVDVGLFVVSYFLLEG